LSSSTFAAVRPMISVRKLAIARPGFPSATRPVARSVHSGGLVCGPSHKCNEPGLAQEDRPSTGGSGALAGLWESCGRSGGKVPAVGDNSAHPCG
jgi:hypothetical protein